MIQIGNVKLRERSSSFNRFRQSARWQFAGGIMKRSAQKPAAAIGAPALLLNWSDKCSLSNLWNLSAETCSYSATPM